MTLYYLLWHEQSNLLAICADKLGWVPKLTIVDEDFDGEKEFITYPLNMLSSFGWHNLGEL